MFISYLRRLGRLIFGLALSGLGCYFSVQANVGLAPWDTLAMGLSARTGQSYGNMTVLVGLVVLAIDLLLREKIGFGTILNALLLGKFADLAAFLGLMPRQQHLLPGVAVLLLGQLILCFGAYFYISAGLSCGPCDSLMVALSRRFARLPVGLVRGCLEAAVLLLGWLLGAKVGVGTVIAVFGVGLMLEAVFRLMRFDLRAQQHESVMDTLRILKGGGLPPQRAEKEADKEK